MTLVSLLASLLLFTPAQAGRRRAAPDVVEDALAFALTDRSKAITLLEQALESKLDPDDVPQVALHAAEHHRLAGQPGMARPWFEKAAAASEPAIQNAAALGLALILTAEAERAQPPLSQIPEKGVLDTQNADRFFWLTVAATQHNDVSAVKDYTKRALGYARSDPTVRARIQADLARIADGGEFEPSSAGTPLEKAQAALAKGNMSRAIELAQKAEAVAPEGSFEQLQAHYVAKRATANRPVAPNKIAVLLPLSGKYENVGNQVRQAFEFGFRKGGGNRQLLFIDTLATPEGAVEALEEAVLSEGVIAVVGPLLSDASAPVVQAAAALEVPLISISQANESTEHGWVFQGVPTIGDQVHALLDHVLLQESMERFAIFAPDSKYGHRSAVAFRAEAEARGATITSEVFYDPAANSLMEFASTLGKKNYEERKGELYRLRNEAEAAGRDRADVVLPPSVDFDAIFLPDNARRVPIACAALAFEEFAIGEFRPMGRRAVPLLGLAGWNDRALVRAGGEYVRQSLFTDAFHKPSAPDFVAAFKADTGRTPTGLEAVTVDAGHLVGAASRASAQDRDAFRSALAEATVEGTTTGTPGFSTDTRRSQATIRMLTITRSGLHPVDAPPKPDDP